MSKQQVSRRQFCEGLASLAILLSGCGSSDGAPFSSGGGGGSNITDPTVLGGTGEGVPIQGTINRDEVGGTNLTVSSLNQFNAPLSGDTFTLLLSDTNPQLLFLTDTVNISSKSIFDGVLRALGLHIPGLALSIGAESTALAMLFLTYPIFSADPAEALKRTTDLRALKAFPALRAYLVANLPVKALTSLASDTQLQNLRKDCVDEFLANQVVRPKLLPDEFYAKGGIEMTPGIADNGDVRLTFENSGTRFVSMVRQSFDASGKELEAVPVKLDGAVNFTPSRQNSIISGLNTLSWGALWTGQVFTPASAYHDFKPDPKARDIIFWLEGAGFGKQANDTPGETVQNQFYSYAYALTIFNYLVLPLLDLLAGGAVGITVVSQYKDIGKAIKLQEALEKLEPVLAGSGIAAVFATFIANYRSGDSANIIASLLDMMVAIFGIFNEAIQDKKLVRDVLVFIYLLSPLSISAANSAATLVVRYVACANLAGILLSATGALFGLINLDIARDHLVNMPTWVKVRYPRTTISYTDFLAGPESLLFVDKDGEIVYTHQNLTKTAILISVRPAPPAPGGTQAAEFQLSGEGFRAIAANNSKQTIVIGEGYDPSTQRLLTHNSLGAVTSSLSLPADTGHFFALGDSGIAAAIQGNNLVIFSDSQISRISAQAFSVFDGEPGTSSVFLAVIAVLNSRDELLLLHVDSDSRQVYTEISRFLVLNVRTLAVVETLVSRTDTGFSGFFLDTSPLLFNAARDLVYSQSEKNLDTTVNQSFRVTPDGVTWVMRSTFTATAMNNDGLVSGYFTQDGTTKAALWTRDNIYLDTHDLISTLAHIPATRLKSSKALAIGDGGHIVGEMVALQLPFPDQPEGPGNSLIEVRKTFIISPL